MKSGSVNCGPYGTGHPLVQVTCDATRNSPHETQSVIAGRQSRSTGTATRTERAAQAIAEPPATNSSRATMKTRAVGIPTAPSSLT